jgi:alpha-L-rhamnosidase
METKQFFTKNFGSINWIASSSKPRSHARRTMHNGCIVCRVCGLLGRLHFYLLLSIPLLAYASTIQPATAGTKDADWSEVVVKDLKTEHLTDPIGIDSDQPRFRWQLQSSRRGQMQTAYQIQVASSLERLKYERPDKWDSGKVISDNSVEVRYEGNALRSGERAYWKIRVWDQTGKRSAYTAPSFFEMGLIKRSDWKGQWIATASRVSSPLFRREISLENRVLKARAYISGIGNYELSINGKKVGDRVLDPASTYYQNDLPFDLNTRALYSTYDVTDALRRGDNAIGVVLGHGWYSAEVEPDLFRDPYSDRPRFILQLNAELADGRTVSIVSGAEWKTSSGPITYNDLFHGEVYDARLEQPGWDQPGFNDATWENVSVVNEPSGSLTAQQLPPTRIVETLPIARVLTPREPQGQFFKGTYIYDFAQNFTGWVRIGTRGPRNSKIVIRYAARIDPEDYTLDNRSNATPIADARQTDVYFLKGDDTELWEPRFTLHSFRYAEVRCFTEEPCIQTIDGRVVRSAVESTGTFTSSNVLLNRIHRNIQWTLMSSLQGIPQDAAERGEREAWLGDPGFVAEDYIHNFEMAGFFEKWLVDVKDSQRQDGSLPLMAPPHLRRGQGGYKVWPSWQSTYPLLVWYLYQYYGDKQVVVEHYPNLRKLVDLYARGTDDNLFDSEPLGDHMEPQENGFSQLASRHTPPALTANAYYYYNVSLVAQMANALGLSADANKYKNLAERIEAAFNRRFFDAATNQYATGSQTSNALPLYLNMVPRDRVPAVVRNLLSDIAKRDNHVSTGIIGSNALVHVLPKHGAASAMYKLATQTTYPSLGHQVMRGATTICETYECGPWVSQNMKMFASLDKFFYRDLAGINLGSPGYRRVSIQPQPVGELKNVVASQKTIRGTVTVDWTKEIASFDLKVTIPAGMEAAIFVPTLGLKDVRIDEGETPVWRANAYVPGTPGLTRADASGDSITFQTGSGSYHFTLSGAPN